MKLKHENDSKILLNILFGQVDFMSTHLWTPRLPQEYNPIYCKLKHNFTLI